MLLYQDCGGSQEGYLFAVQDGTESGAHGYLSLSIAHIAAQQPIHVARLGHVRKHFIDCLFLIRCQLIIKLIGKLPLKGLERLKRITRDSLPGSIKLDQVKGELFEPRFHFGFLFDPCIAAQVIQRRCSVRAANVFLYPVKLICRHIQLVAAAVLDKQVIPPDTF